MKVNDLSELVLPLPVQGQYSLPFVCTATEPFAINSGHQSVSSFNCCNLLLFHLCTFCNYARFETLLTAQGWRPLSVCLAASACSAKGQPPTDY